MKIINEYLKLKFIGQLFFFIFLSFFINKTFADHIFDYQTEADYFADSKIGNTKILEEALKKGDYGNQSKGAIHAYKESYNLNPPSRWDIFVTKRFNELIFLPKSRDTKKGVRTFDCIDL